VVEDCVTSLDRETVLWLHRSGETSADTATVQLLAVSARARLEAGVSPSDGRLAARVGASPVADGRQLRRLRTEAALRRWRRAERILNTFARPVAREQAVAAAQRSLEACRTVDALVAHYLAQAEPAGGATTPELIELLAADPDAPPAELVAAAGYRRRFGELVAAAAAQATPDRR
jgi:hypothetical protein